MAAIIFWTVIFCATFFTVGFMVCAIGGLLLHKINSVTSFLTSLGAAAIGFIIADIFPFVFIIIFWLI